MKNSLTAFIVVMTLLFAFATNSGAAVKKKRFDVNEVNELSAPTAVVADTGPLDVSHFSLMATLSETQKVLREKLTIQIDSMKAGENSAIWMFLAICFLYGMLHALGPGHGKSIVIGYFLARRSCWRQGIALGAGITFTHTLSAVLLLFVLFGIFRATVFPFFEVGRGGIEKASYILLMITGLLLVGLGIADFIKSRRQPKGKETVGKANLPPEARWREIIGVAAITGLVPCPAVALIVLFCLLNSMVALALTGSAFVCMGMTCTNVLFGIVAVAFRKCIDKKTVGSRFAVKIYALTSVIGGAIIFMSGFLLIGNHFLGRI